MSLPDATEAGARAPDFKLSDATGTEWHLAEKRGRVVVLLFYPGDETPICTKQMCAVRDRWEDYQATGAEIVGISTNSVASHRSFAEHHRLPLTLLADPEGVVTASYGVRSWLPGRSARAVFVIDAEGLIRYRKVQPISLLRPNDDEIITAIRSAQSRVAASPAG